MTYLCPINNKKLKKDEKNFFTEDGQENDNLLKLKKIYEKLIEEKVQIPINRSSNSLESV